MQIILRKIPHELIFVRHTNCQLLRHYANRVPTKAAAVAVSTEEESSQAELLHSVAVPVQNIPTVDVSKRSSAIAMETSRGNSGAVSSTVATATTSIAKATAAKELKQLEQQMLWHPTPRPIESPQQLLGYYKKLSKFRLTSLVVITAMGGYAMAPAAFDLSTFVLCSLGTGLVSAAANSINQYHEVPFDSQMSRTKNRVLVTGQVTPLHAVGFAAVSATAGLSMLYFGVNGLTAALGAGNFFLYTSIYTPMKRMSILNTWIGSIVGAIPPLMGWAGCAGHLDAGAWIMAGILYAWQFPHFNALSWNLRPDYSRAGYRMMAVTNPGLCRRVALRYTIALGGLSLLAPALDVTNAWFALETLPLNAYFIYLAYKFHQKSDSGSSRKLFRFSLIHLPALMLLFLCNKKRWIFKEESTTAALVVTTTAATETIRVDGTEALKRIEKASTLLQFPTATGLANVLPIAIAASEEATESQTQSQITKNLAAITSSDIKSTIPQVTSTTQL